jgi:teichuronic acid exporter
MDNLYKKDKVFSSLVWKILELGGIRGVTFIVAIILARILSPSDFGILALITVFINIASVFVEGGLNTALIQKKDSDEVDYSSVFFVSLLIAVFLYVLLFFLAPPIARLYNSAQLVPVIRVLSVILIPGSVNSIQIAILSKKMQFRKIFTCNILSAIISAIIGITCALMKYGVWALVAQQLSNQFSIIIIMAVVVKWRPKRQFSKERLGTLVSYGWKILASNLINAIFLNVRSLIIGKLFSSEQLGYYNRGLQFPQIIMQNVDGAMQSVMLPVYSSRQDEKDSVKKMVRRSIVTSTYVIFPMMVGLAIIAKPLVTILLTSKWLPCVPYLQVYCVTFMIMPIHTANIQSIKAMGYSNITLKLEVIRKVVEATVLVISINFGVFGIAVGSLISTLISLIVNLFPNNKILKYTYLEQFKDILPALLLALIMGGIIYSVKFLINVDWLLMTVQILLGAAAYIGMSRLFKLESFSYLKNVAGGILKRKST